MHSHDPCQAGCSSNGPPQVRPPWRHTVMATAARRGLFGLIGLAGLTGLAGLSGDAQAGDLRWYREYLPPSPDLGTNQAIHMTAINNTGEVAGFATGIVNRRGRQQAFLYSSKQMLTLGTLTSASQPGWRPTSISDPTGPRGTVYAAGNLAAQTPFDSTVFVQRVDTLLNQVSTARTFSINGAQSMAINGINANGQYVGQYNVRFGSTHAFAGNRDDEITPLQALSNAQPTSFAHAINDAGMVVGYARSNNNDHATLWNAQTGAVQDIGALGSKSSFAYAINKQGVVVGKDGVDGNPVGQGHAFLYRNGVFTRIASNLDAQGAHGGTSEATSINNKGQTLGRYQASAALPEMALFLHTASGGAVSLAGMGMAATDEIQINDLGQIVAGGALYSPSGTLTWAQSAGGSVGVAEHWDSGMGFTPNRYLDVLITTRSDQTISADTSFQAASLRIDGGPLGQATMALSRGAVVNAIFGATVGTYGRLQGEGRIVSPGRAVTNHGVVQALPGKLLVLDSGLDNRGLVTGNGRIEADLSNSGGSAPGVQVGAGQHLTLAGTAHTMHAGAQARIQDGGTLAFQGRLVNLAGATLEIQRGTLQVDYGANRMQNSGVVQVGSGRAEILGDVFNSPSGLIHAQQGADLTVWDPLVNDGEVRVSGGARVVYAAGVSGKGSFTGLDGMHRFEGGYSPGAAPAEVTLGNVELASLVTLSLGGLTAGSQHDRINFTGSVLFEASSFLEISLINGFTPRAGDRFSLFSYTQAPVGNFEDFYLPGLGAGLNWDVSQLHTSGDLLVAGVPEPGSWALMLLGVVGVAGRAGVAGWRKRPA